jgi:hypothetical protein
VSTSLLAGLTALILTVTTACTSGVMDVHIDELGDEAEAIGESLMATIEDVERGDLQDGINSGWSWTNAEGGERDPFAKRYWYWSAHVFPALGAAITPEESAQLMAEVLEDSGEGWTATKPPGNEGGGKWTFRRPADRGAGDWYVGINFSRNDTESLPPEMRIEVVSPNTSNRSESEKTKNRNAERDAVRTFEQVAARLEAALDEHEALLKAQRLRLFLRGGGDRKVYLDALSQWEAAAGEVRDTIRLARESLGLTALDAPNTGGESR